MTPPNIDLKALWQQQEATPPSLQTVVQNAQKFQRYQLFQLIALSSTLVITIGFLIWIWWFYQPKLLTTKIGIVLVILSIILFLSFQSKLLPLLLKENNQLSNKEYLALLQLLQQKTNTIQTNILSIYFVLLSAGIALYLYEYTLQMPLSWLILCYGCTTLWILFNWCYLRPKIIKKQQQKIEALQTQFKTLQRQLEE
ncbi:MAG: hypothetical protein ACRBFS_11615 [Aureispira sp.]